jgi:hypothetical protein
MLIALFLDPRKEVKVNNRILTGQTNSLKNRERGTRMAKKISIVLVVTFVFCLIGHPAFAKNPSEKSGKSNMIDNPAAAKGLSVKSENSNMIKNSKGPKGPSGPAGKSNVAHLYLHEKDPETWDIIEGGAWGKMKFNLSGSVFRFVFNGHGLVPGSVYTLIYYPDPWPGTGLICLGSEEADDFGNVHIKNIVDTGDLPLEEDENKEGAKIWLVLFDDVKCDAGMVGWNPSEYLFEYDTISFDDTDEDLDNDLNEYLDEDDESVDDSLGI